MLCRVKYYIISGEASGDLHGSHLMRALQETDPVAEFRFWGGEKMQAVGGELVTHYRDMAFMGFWEVFKNLRYITKKMRFCKEDILQYQPDGVGVEEVFVNSNPQSTLKLGQARGALLLSAARGGLEIGEYAARLVKKAVVGVGNADKAQVHAMVSRLLPGAKIAGPDAADALAVAITHAHHLASARRLG